MKRIFNLKRIILITLLFVFGVAPVCFADVYIGEPTIKSSTNYVKKDNAVMTENNKTTEQTIRDKKEHSVGLIILVVILVIASIFMLIGRKRE